jgi:uncharacterized DUF497 family protein
MKLIFDARRDASNLAKYGVSLALAHEMEWGFAQCKIDTRRDYGEPRHIGYSVGGDRLYCVVFVDRPTDAPSERRIISLRHATKLECSRLASFGAEVAKHRPWLEPSQHEDEVISVAMAHDADTYELGAAEFRQLRVCPVPHGGKKVELTLRLDAGLVEKLKAMGPDWQSRVNDGLQAWVEGG